MRTRSWVIGVCLLFVLAGTASAQVSGVDETRIKFIEHCGDLHIYGVVGKEVDLTGAIRPRGWFDSTKNPEDNALAVISLGEQYQEQTCRKGKFDAYIMELFRGDPSTLDAKQFNLLRDNTPVYHEMRRRYGEPVIRLRAYNRGTARERAEYRNKEQEKKEDDAKAAAYASAVAEEQRRFRAEKEIQDRAANAARQKRQAEVSARSSAFVNANGVRQFVTLDQLSANPFVYQGQVIALYGVFERMIAATEAQFAGSNGDPFIVTGVPSARFTRSRVMVMLAGRVVGNKEVKLPLIGAVLAPQISFVGSAFCQEQKCAEYQILPK